MAGSVPRRNYNFGVCVTHFLFLFFSRPWFSNARAQSSSLDQFSDLIDICRDTGLLDTLSPT